MKRHGNLWEKLVSMENIELAYQKAKKQKMWQRQVQEVEADKEAKLKAIQEMLVNKTYQVSPYREKKIYEPKERTIYILPFYPDRIVHHALMNILAPIWDNMFIYDSYSCRVGKGQHKASMKCQKAVVNNSYVLQCDISKFYPSINHNIMLSIVKRKIKDRHVLWLVERIVRSFPSHKNVPIGNFTSQWLGNLFLHELDMKVKQEYKKDYVRYCDDFLIFGNDKEELWRIGQELRQYCHDERKLTLSKLRLYETTDGVDFLGYRHMKKHYILLRKSTVKRFKKRVKTVRWEVKHGLIPLDRARSSVDSIIGWMKHANTFHLRQKLGIEELRGDIMKGLPKQLNSKNDYMFAHNHLNENYWRPAFQELLDSRFGWFFDKDLANKEEGIEDDTHKIVENRNTEDESVSYAQYIWKENDKAKIFRIGFTVEEVEELLGA